MAEVVYTKEQFEALQKEVERLKADKAKAQRISFKISEKGCLSMYGLGRFPVSLYGSQWERLIAAVPQVQAFMKDNAHLLKTKDDAKPTA